MSNFTNSPLISLTRLSPNRNAPRNQPIDRITIHHFAGNSTIEGVSGWLADAVRQASYNYGIGSDGRIVQIVEERNRSWASSSPANDHRAVVIGVANDTLAPNWTVSDTAFEKLIDLCVDICQRNNIPGFFYDGTSKGSLTRHNMFSNQVCPGPFLQSRFPEICELVNARLGNPPNIPASEFPLDEENILRMVDLGVIASPDFWRGVSSVEWLNDLLINAGRAGYLDQGIDNGIADLETALRVLEGVGVMGSPAYWRYQARNSDVRFLEQLIINMANRARYDGSITQKPIANVTADELDILHRIVWAEARGEDVKGQILVVNVIMNRVKSTQFRHANTIREVVFAPNQFEPTRNGAFERAVPTQQNKEAVRLALQGEDHSRGALFFDSAVNSWARQKRQHLFDHGNHSFFA